jgi:hypothetical protein
MGLAGVPSEGRPAMPIEPGEVTFAGSVVLTYAIAE